MSDHAQGTLTWIDAIATPFDRAWRAGQRPRIEDCLAGEEESRRFLLFEELLRLELYWRREAGELPTAEDYWSRFPEHAQSIREIFADSAPLPLQPLVVESGNSEVGGPPPFAGPVDATGSYQVIAIEADPNATLPYSVVRDGGQVEPLLSPQDLEHLATTFYPGIVLQGRYVLERELGRGGMGLVFLGRDNRLNRSVAIKAILPSDSGSRARGSTTEEKFRDRFLEEARIGANLTHPAIATVYDFGLHLGTPFTVFEYISGPTLRDILRARKRLPLEEVRTLIGPLAQALDFAHARFVVHRDLKPENIKATDQGPLKILDLGLAKEFRSHVDWTGFAGTPAYAAPEQAAGQPCDGRTDQYSLALIVYEMLTGRRQFTASTPLRLLELQRTELPLSPKHHIPDLPDRAAAAILRALEKGPQHRFSSCCQFADSLGCNLIRYPVSSSDILRRSNVTIRPKIFGPLSDLLFFGTFIPYFASWTGHIARTREALYVAYNDEVTTWENEDVLLLPNASPRKLSLVCSDCGDEKSLMIKFEDADDARGWHDELVNLPYSSADSPQSVTSNDTRRPKSCVIPLLRRSPSAMFQVLGSVEATARLKRSAEAALTLEAAVLDADLVADVEAERLPGFKSTEWRLTGYAMRAVDHAGQREAAVRWTNSKISVLFWSWMTLLGVNALANLFSIYEIGFVLIFGLVPFGLNLTLRVLRWPQLLRPTSAATFIFSLYYLVISIITLSILNVVNALLFLMMRALSKELWLTYNTISVIFKEERREPSAHRRAAEIISWFIVSLYTAPLVIMPFIMFIRYMMHLSLSSGDTVSHA